jgi:RNA polymerase sigma factor (sigma-70 family)
VLAHNACSIRDPDRVATWLYGVALRAGRKARARTARQRIHEKGGEMDAMSKAAVEPSAPPADQALLDRERAEALHGEIDRLPDAFRSPVVLCYIEGLTVEEAARRLRCPSGTVRSRLARAREKLRRALTPRGFVLPGAALAAILDSRPASASISPHLGDLTARAAIRYAARQAVAATETALAREVLRAMTIHKLRTTALALMLMAAFGTSALFIAGARAMNDKPRDAPAAALTQTAAKRDTPPHTAPGRMLVAGRVLDPQGKPIPNATVMVFATLKQPWRANDVPRTSGAVPIAHAVADDSGRFRVDTPRTSSSRYHRVGATALAPGFAIGWSTIDPDQDEPSTEITLQPEQAIQGRIFDVQGRAVPDVRISVWFIKRILHRNPDVGPGQAEGPTLSWSQINDLPGWPGPAITDALGRFNLRGLGRGLRVALSINDPRFPLQTIWHDIDGNLDSKQLTIALEPARIITGRITYADTGAPVPHSGLSVESYEKNVITSTDFRADGEGQFRANPTLGERFDVIAHPPDGQPYLSVSKRLDWPKGAVERAIELALPRGVLIRGKVTEVGTGAPVAGAAVRYVAPSRRDAEFNRLDNPATTSADGSFAIAVPPEPGQLIIQGPSDDYVLQEISNRQGIEGQPGGYRRYAHGFTAYSPKPGSDRLEVNAALRRGATVKGRVIGPDGRTVQDAWIIGRTILRPFPTVYRLWRGGEHDIAHNGRFELHGLDPDAAVPVHFLEPQGKLGATAYLPGKSPAGEAVVIRLESCGTATARLVDPAGKPVAGFRASGMITMVVTPGAPTRMAVQNGQLFADEDILTRIDPINHAEGPVSEANGRISFPALIPGANYNVRSGPRGRPPSFRKDFTVQSGEMVDLGDIPIERPPG